MALSHRSLTVLWREQKLWAPAALYWLASVPEGGPSSFNRVVLRQGRNLDNLCDSSNCNSFQKYLTEMFPIMRCIQNVVSELSKEVKKPTSHNGDTHQATIA